MRLSRSFLQVCDVVAASSAHGHGDAEVHFVFNNDCLTRVRLDLLRTLIMIDADQVLQDNSARSVQADFILFAGGII